MTTAAGETGAGRRRGPLSGIKVVDFSRVVAGPICGRILADQGADVVKIEPFERDMTRAAEPFVDAMSSYFAHLNAGKRCISVDLRDAEAIEVMRSLVDEADVLLENFRPGVLARRGLGPDEARARNQGLVYCSISGYGQDGPWRDRRCFAPVVHGEAGMLATSARLGDRPPAPEAHSSADFHAGFLAASAIGSALFDRSRTGEGAHLDISLAEASIYANEFSGPELAGQEGPTIYGGSACLVVTLADGTAVATQGNPATRWNQWCAAMDRPDLLTDPRFARYPDRLARRDAVDAEVMGWAATVKDYATFEPIAEREGLAVGVIRTVPELADTEWAVARNAIAEPSPGLRMPAAPFRSSAGHVGVTDPAPVRGADNATVLAEWLGVDRERYEAMAARGVFDAGADGRG